MIAIVAITSCATRKRKEDVSGFKKFYHTFTSKYNGYFNANELMEESIATLEASHQDNYNQILPVYPIVEVSNPKMVAEDLDLAIEKVIRVATIHDVGKYVDDCYVLMGKAQYLKQDYETAQETFEYFEEEFNPANPYGSNFKKKKKKSKKQVQREREVEKENKKKKAEEEKKVKEEQRKAEREAKEKAREEAKKAKEEERKRKKKEREDRLKKEKKEREARKKGKKRSRKRKTEDDKSKEEASKEENKTEEAVEEPIIDNKSTKDTEPVEEVKEEIVAEKVAEDTGEVEEEYIPPTKKEKEEDDTSYSEGMLWLARTYIEREKYTNAEYILRKLENSKVNDKVYRGIAPAKAHLYLSQKEYEKALPALLAAIETSDSGEEKARYAYIMAQIYQRKGNYAEALDAFKMVKDHKGDFRMDFNADLSIAKNGLLAGTDTRDEVFKKINKMLGEDKYAEFKDQVYFTLGEIALAQGKDQEALDNFTLSIRNNAGNAPLLAEAYYNMANLNYEKEMYVDAKYYYDSTLISMPKQDERHLEVSNYSKSLSNIARNIEIIELQDSLLALADMPEDALRDIAERIIKEERENEKKKANPSSPNKKGKGGAFSTAGSNRKRGFGKSKFFAYNLSSKEKGVKEFRKRWGDRKLEDNWRRLESQSFNTFDEEEETETEIEITDAEMKRVLADVPTTVAAKQKANEKIQDALYDLGLAFRGKINNYQKAIDALEELLQRYPQTEKRLDALYYLYLTHIDMNNVSQAERYKTIVVDEFPDSKYAKALTDPNFLKSLEEEESSVELYYSNTYEIFESGDYAAVKTRIDKSEALFGKDNNLRAKFGLLEAMVIGNEKGKDGYVKALQDVITRYPNTPEQTRAREIMRFLKGDGNAFDVVEIKEVDNIFEMEPDKLHYVAIIVYESGQEKFTDAKIAVSNFNKKYYKTKKLQLSDIFLNRDEGSQIILVRKFKNSDEAMDYYDTVEKNKDAFIDEKVAAYEVFPITQRNYRKVVGERSASKYRVFFEKNYVK